jgi:cold shock CspA family protein
MEKIQTSKTPAIKQFIDSNPLLYEKAKKYPFEIFKKIYVDTDILTDDKKQNDDEENGQLTSTPPDHGEKAEINIDDIQLGAAPIEAEELRKTGIVTFLSEKGYGFITEDKTKENIFFHSNNCAEPVKKGNKVSYEKEKSPKGFSAAEIQLVK